MVESWVDENCHPRSSLQAGSPEREVVFDRGLVVAAPLDDDGAPERLRGGDRVVVAEVEPVGGGNAKRQLRDRRRWGERVAFDETRLSLEDGGGVPSSTSRGVAQSGEVAELTEDAAVQRRGAAGQDHEAADGAVGCGDPWCGRPAQAVAGHEEPGGVDTWLAAQLRERGQGAGTYSSAKVKLSSPRTASGQAEVILSKRATAVPRLARPHARSFNGLLGAIVLSRSAGPEPARRTTPGRHPGVVERPSVTGTARGSVPRVTSCSVKAEVSA